MRRSLQWYIGNGCQLIDPDPDLLTLIYAETSGWPCNGCSHTLTCQTYHLVEKSEHELEEDARFEACFSRPAGKKTETNAEIAARLGISKRQVAKMRRNGEL